MFVWTPVSKARKIIKDFPGVGMKDMWSIPVDQYSCFVKVVKRITTNMVALVNKENLLAYSARRSASTLPAKPAPTIR